MIPIKAFDPVAVPSGTILIGASTACARILLYNRSPVDLQLNFPDGGTAYLHAMEARVFARPIIVRSIDYSTLAILNSANYPLSQIKGEVYTSEEHFEGTYPVQLAGIANIGNTLGVNTNVVATQTTLVNDGSVANTQIVESTLVGGTASNIKLDNSGNVTIAEYVGSVYTKLLQVVSGAATPILIGALTRLTRILGSLQVDGATTLTGATTITGVLTANNAGNTLAAAYLYTGINFGGQLGRIVNADTVDAAGNDAYYKCTGASGNAILQGGPSGGAWLLQSGGVTVLAGYGNNGVLLPSGKIGRTVVGDLLDAGGGTDLYLKVPNGKLIVYSGGAFAWSRRQETYGTVTVTGGTTGVITHGCGGIPDLVTITPVNAPGTTGTWSLQAKGSATFSLYAYGPTQTFDWKAERK